MAAPSVTTAGCPAWDVGDVHLWEHPVEEEGPQAAHPDGLPGQSHLWDLETQLAAPCREEVDSGWLR